MQKKRLSASERDAMLRISAAAAIIGTEPDKLAQRMEGADLPFAKRDMGLVRSKIFKLLEALVLTIPDDQLLSFKKQIHNSTYNVGVRNPLQDKDNDKDYGIWLPYSTVYTLLAGCHDRCMMCDMDKGQRRGCKLKKAIDSIPNDTPDRQDGDCPYYTVI
jgi:hypothetical protein